MSGSSPTTHLIAAASLLIGGCGGGGGADVPPVCLPAVKATLTSIVKVAPFAPVTAPTMQVWPIDGPRFNAARAAVLAWSGGDCAGFRTAAATMGYTAEELTETTTNRRLWILRDSSAQYNGVFAFRAPSEAAQARPLVIDAPHLGFDFSDDRAVRAFLETNAVALLQNTAHRCSLPGCSGCSPSVKYACGDDNCMRQSDVVHSVASGYYAVYDALEAVRDDFHFEYHGSAATANIAGCTGAAHISQGSLVQLAPADDDGTYPNRFWQALSARIGATCTCYHQRQTGCLLAGTDSTAGRRTNEDVASIPLPDAGVTTDECTVAAPRPNARFLHMEAFNVNPDNVIAALNAAIP